jgi:glyoxylase-like metal-dependent hydrolase (beta-lactamase superfamily II)
MSELKYETFLVRREGVTRDLPEGGDNDDLRWVINTATLIYGERDAVLVDTFTTVEQNDRLVEWVRAHDRRLTHVFLTHGHGDHVFGVGQLLAAFPGAEAVGTAGTVEEARLQSSEEYRDSFWGRLFPGQIPAPVIPSVLAGDRIELEGNTLAVLDLGFTDTSGTSALWVPSIGVIVAGDVVYDRTHMYLAETTRETRDNWRAALGRLKALGADRVVAGHRQPDGIDDPSDIDESIRYLTDFDDAAARTTTPEELYRAMLIKHGRRANPGALWGAAKLAKPAA